MRHAKNRLISDSSVTTGETNGQKARPARLKPDSAIAVSTWSGGASSHSGMMLSFSYHPAPNWILTKITSSHSRIARLGVMGPNS